MTLVTLIDDDEAVLESLPDLVKEFGYPVVAFASAETFLLSDAVDRTACLILDVTMPGMAGLELWQKLKRRDEAIPVIFITACRDEALRAHLLRQGACDCLFKPFSDNALLSAIKIALGEA
ncbi:MULTISPECIES: response regulator [Burkholderiaceae]|uniref:response regulator n=1 Tax=Burkholderiaceae TaxID=119060 RepID=UPI0014203EEB|nr:MULTISPECIES: response regulator [Burkholderiaceae]MBN3846797.1 response regulator [Paraburkholderia sp. Ac-20342]NIF51196.1 response regulator [Burkholderia sp. Ax-1724]NIF76022.1 response regulator [Paraburkholderia sp. Cy-641]